MHASIESEWDGRVVIRFLFVVRLQDFVSHGAGDVAIFLLVLESELSSCILGFVPQFLFVFCLPLFQELVQD